MYLSGMPFPVKVITDHNPLLFLNKFKNKNQRLTRWSLFLQEWDLEISHVKGKDNIVPDALSRVWYTWMMMMHFLYNCFAHKLWDFLFLYNLIVNEPCSYIWFNIKTKWFVSMEKMHFLFNIYSMCSVNNLSWILNCYIYKKKIYAYFFFPKGESV